MNRNLRRAFTLLEVILALGISFIVMAAIGYMIDFQLRSVDESRGRVEEVQLARAVLQRMADDIRGAVRYDPLDFKSFLPSSAASFDADALASAASGSGASGGGSSPSSSGSGAAGSGAADTDTSSADSSLSTETAPPIPGLYGAIDERGLYMLQVDVSRLPRLDEYQQLMAVSEDGSSADHVSDVKTVTYYIHPTLGGLVRRVRSRASDQYAAEMGVVNDSGDATAVIAPEVVKLQFRYFDGTAWVYDWDSDARQGLPLAVEIMLAFQPFNSAAQPAATPGADSPYGSGATLPTAATGELRVYRLVVHLPAAEPTTLEGTETTTAADTTSTDSASSGGSR